MDINKIWIVLRIIILSLVGFYIIIILYFSISQSRFIYFPKKNLFTTPKDIGLAYNEIYFTTSDKIKLHGWIIPAKNPKAFIIFCHGNAGNISDRLETIKIFHSLGLTTLIFDYRGYGMSQGHPCEHGTYLDAQAAWNFLTIKQNIKSSEIIVFGRSLGCPIAAWLAQKNNPKLLILESSFTSVKDLAKELYPFLPIKLLCRFDYNTLNYVSRIKSPILIIHSSQDEMIPFSHGQRLFNTANQPKEFLEIKGSHNDGFLVSKEEYVKKLNYFIKKYTGNF